MNPDELRDAADEAAAARSERDPFAELIRLRHVVNILGPAARQYADTQDENERLRELCRFLIDACATHGIPVQLDSSLLDLAADVAWPAADAAAAARGEG